MKYLDNKTARFLTLCALTIFLFSGFGVPVLRAAGISKVTFYVK
jgi:hypothetical protein